MKDEKKMEKKVGLELLREPFKPNQIGKLPQVSPAQKKAAAADFSLNFRCPQCNGWHHKKASHLEYVGHAAITDRLLDADPEWNWKPRSINEDGSPKIENNSLWIELTVCGVTRIGYGDAQTNSWKTEVTKEIIGDAIRNAAMRFGVGLEMWHKGNLHEEDEAPTNKTIAPAEKKEAESKAFRAKYLAQAKKTVDSFVKACEAKDPTAPFGQQKKPMSEVYETMLNMQKDGKPEWDEAIKAYADIVKGDEIAFEGKK